MPFIKSLASNIKLVLLVGRGGNRRQHKEITFLGRKNPGKWSSLLKQ